MPYGIPVLDWKAGNNRSPKFCARDNKKLSYVQYAVVLSLLGCCSVVGVVVDDDVHSPAVFVVADDVAVDDDGIED